MTSARRSDAVTRMRILIDRTPSAIAATTITEALAAVAEHAEQLGRIIVEVHMDGRPLGESELAGIDDTTALPDELLVMTSTISELLSETFRQCAEAVEEAGQAQSACAGHLQAGRRVEAMERLDEAVGLWTQVNTAVRRGLELADWKADALDLGAPSLPEAVQDLSARLLDIREAAQLRDDVRLADCLLYDMPDTTDRWLKVLPALASLAMTHKRS